MQNELHETFCSNYYIFCSASSSFLLRRAFYFDKSFIIFQFSSRPVFCLGNDVYDLASSFILKFSFSSPSTFSSSSTILSSFSSSLSSGAPKQFWSKLCTFSSFYSNSTSKHLTLFLRKPTSPFAFTSSSLFVSGYSFTPELIVDLTLLTYSSLEISCLSMAINLSSFSVFSIRICILPENCCFTSRTWLSNVLDLATTPEYFYFS